MKRLINTLLRRTGHGGPASSSADRLAARRRPSVEALEPRKLLTDIQVSHLENWDFEAAVNFANSEPGADVITFAPELSGTIMVSARQSLFDTITIRGNGKIALSGGDTSSILQVFDNVSATIENMTFTHSLGEAIRDQGSLTLTSCTFDSNFTAGPGGGALMVRPGHSAVVTRCVFTGNSASRPNSNSGAGGAIYNSGTLTVTDSTFENNYSYRDGGAIYNDTGASLVVNRSTFFNNTADTGDGGAVRNLGSASLTDSTIAGNHGVIAGGLNGDMNVTFCTIAYNTGKYVAGGVMGQGNFILSNTIVAKNTVNDSPADIGGGSTNFWSHPTSITYNLIGDVGTSDGVPNQYGNLIGYDPKFLTSTPVDNCGFTKTISIAADSPAVDNGYSTSTFSDQRGFNRLSQGAGMDIGAVERQTSAGVLTVNSTADAVDGDYSEGNLTLREAVNIALQSNLGAAISIVVPANSTITLTLGTLQIAGNTSISGGAEKITVDGGGQARVFQVTGGTHEISGLTIAHGFSTDLGAGLRADSCTLTLSDISFVDNTSTSIGGAVAVSNSTVTVTGATFSGNTSTFGGGGAIYATASPLQIRNSTFSDNNARFGAAISSEFATLSVYNSTVAYNVSGNSVAGAISSTSLVLVSSIVAQNTAGDLDAHLEPGSVNNLIGDSNTAGSLVNGQNGNIVGADPKLGPLEYNGGLTKTRALLAGSPAIGAGSNPLNLTNDQRGNGYFRVRFGNPDIGAFEVIKPTITSLTSSAMTIAFGHPATLTANGVLDGDGTIQAVEFYKDTNANGLPDSGEYMGADFYSAGGYTFEFNPGGLPGGTLTLICVAYDDDGNTGTASLAVTIAPPSAQTYTVSATDDIEDGDYTAGHLSLREAVQLANANAGVTDTINFASSLNGQTLTMGLDDYFVTDSVTITGPGRSLLTIDAHNVSRVFRIEPEATVTISGLSMVRGYHGDRGGAIYNLGTLTLQDVLIGSSFAGSVGGGIFSSGTLTLNNSLLSDNAADHAGGAVEHTGFMFMDRTTIDSNAAGAAGGISVNGGNLTMTNSLIVGNGLTDTGSDVGGGGGIAVSNGGIADITCSTITGNTATFALGGGIFNKDGTVHLKNSTVAANSQTGSFGGGIDTETGSTRLDSTIVAGNQGGDIHGDLDVHSSYNLIQDSGAIVGITNGANGNITGVDPKLAALADNGGSTRTMALLAHSPAIGKATNPLGIATDQRGNGFARTKGGRTDIGAFESDFATVGNDLLGASAGTSGNINITGRDSGDHPLIFQQNTGQAWTVIDLQTRSASPAITGEIVTWVDPKDGRNYAAGMSAQGLILFTNVSGNSWSYRNLGSEIPGIPAITGNLTTFTSIDNRVSVAGVDAAGDLIRYVQTGAGASGSYAWTAVNHGNDLRAQGLVVPQFTGRITSFVTPWNALNIVGLDAQGNIQAVWWHQSLNTGGKWTTNNLSHEYGAPPLTGGLTVWLTSWSAINIAGTDSSGKLSTTWWVPGYNNNNWNTNNLTDDIGGPLLQADSMCSWITPWGAMNVAGRESDGTVSVYWWVPNINNNMWQVAHFRDSLPTATTTVGPVSGITELGGDQSMSILSTSQNGDVIRLWWSPATNAWAEQNVTHVATPG